MLYIANCCLLQCLFSLYSHTQHAFIHAHCGGAVRVCESVDACVCARVSVRACVRACVRAGLSRVVSIGASEVVAVSSIGVSFGYTQCCCIVCACVSRTLALSLTSTTF